jgi:hypothetical protein
VFDNFGTVERDERETDVESTHIFFSGKNDKYA